MNKKINFFILLILLLSLTSATTLGTHKQSKCIELIQTCDNCTYNNISRVIYPNKTVAVQDLSMTKDDTYYNYTFCLTNDMGQYLVNGFGDVDGVKTVWAYDFEVTGTGFEFNQPRSLMYVALLGLLIFLFVLSLYTIPSLPTGDNYDEDGSLISINQLKYLRPVLYVVAYMILVAITYTASNISLAYMGETMMGSLFFKIFHILFGLAPLMALLWFVFILYNAVQDRQLKKVLERGWE
ncbi:MAG: hypothetical protein EHM20_00330 [Alphaproteobacteria bacterium]|nr:MAG: hypothetical protein EHM20_00330 [Alphaproteobacteria bacterium]